MLLPSGSHSSCLLWSRIPATDYGSQTAKSHPIYDLMIMRRREKVMLHTVHPAPQSLCLSSVQHCPSSHLFLPAALPCPPPTPHPHASALCSGSLELPLGTSSFHPHTLDPTQQGLCLGFTVLGEQLRTAHHERHSLSQVIFSPVPMKTRYMQSLEYEIAPLRVIPCSY